MTKTFYNDGGGSENWELAAMYGLDKDPLGGQPVLECEGCMSVVKELTKPEALSLRKTPEGLAILERESEVS